MKFNSQIATSRVQSERLLALGLKKKTADCVWIEMSKDDWRVDANGWKEYYSIVQEGIFPAWSLHRLLCLYGADYEIKEVYNNAEECYGMLICAIEIAIENGDFNEEYLER